MAQKIRARLDAIDRRLLTSLAEDATLTAERLGEQLGLSPSQAGRRRQRLEADGVIAAYRAQLSPEALGLGVQAFVQVEMATHDPDAVRSFLRIVEARTDIVGAWPLTGEADYLLRVFCRDLGDLNRLIHETLLPHASVARVRSQIVMAQAKRDASLPV